MLFTPEHDLKLPNLVLTKVEPIDSGGGASRKWEAALGTRGVFVKSRSTKEDAEPLLKSAEILFKLQEADPSKFVLLPRVLGTAKVSTETGTLLPAVVMEKIVEETLEQTTTSFTREKKFSFVQEVVAAKDLPQTEETAKIILDILKELAQLDRVFARAGYFLTDTKGSVYLDNQHHVAKILDIDYIKPLRQGGLNVSREFIFMFLQGKDPPKDEAEIRKMGLPPNLEKLMILKVLSLEPNNEAFIDAVLGSESV
jgi:hypothetical protein